MTLSTRILTASLLATLFLPARPGRAADSTAEDWKCDLSLGANMADGNSRTRTLSLSVTAERVRPSHEWRTGLQGDYGEADVPDSSGDGSGEQTETTRQDGKVFLNGKRKLGAAYAYSDNVLSHDDLAGVDLRAVLGVGGGVHLVQSDRAKLALELGVAYLREELVDAGGADLEQESVALRVAGRHDQTLSKTSKAWASVEYLPLADDAADYLLNAEAGMEASLNSMLSLRFVVQDRYDSEVPSGRENNDVTVAALLVYHLR